MFKRATKYALYGVCAATYTYALYETSNNLNLTPIRARLFIDSFAVDKAERKNDKSLLIGRAVTGKRFNQLYHGVQMQKWIRDNMRHGGFEYKEGLNVNNEPFYPCGSCNDGGLYFTTSDVVMVWWRNYSHLYNVKVPDRDDVYVYIEYDKFKASEIIIEPTGISSYHWSEKEITRELVPATCGVVFPL